MRGKYNACLNSESDCLSIKLENVDDYAILPRREEEESIIRFQNYSQLTDIEEMMIVLRKH